MQIRAYEDQDLDAVIHLSLRSWAPVFASMEQLMDADVYQDLHPDWRIDQRDAVKSVCSDEQTHVWVAEVDDTSVGFVAARHRPDGIGEIYMLAVDPSYQRRGIATALNEFAFG